MSVGARVVLLTVALVVFTMISAFAFDVAGSVQRKPGADAEPAAAQAPPAGPDDRSVDSRQLKAAAGLLAASFLQTLVFSLLVVRSCWSGWRLVLAVFVCFFGVTAVMSQIEAVVFRPQDVGGGVLPRLLGMSAMTTALFALAAVSLFGRWSRAPAGGTPVQPWAWPGRRWAGALAASVIAYVILYVTFGYYVVWQHAMAREFYGGDTAAPGSFAQMIATIITSRPRLIGLQCFRALLWVAFALPVVRMMKGGRAETALAVALLFGVVFPAQLLVPNPWMSAELRMLHLIETTGSNLVFGFVVGWLFAPRRGTESVTEGDVPVAGSARTA
jgi:hypothetical protein